jgi:hypothetical protein
MMIANRNVNYSFSTRSDKLTICGDININAKNYFPTVYLFNPCVPHPFSIDCRYHIIALSDSKKVIGYLSEGRRFIDISNLY